MHEEERRRSTVDASGQQVGEQQVSAAGRDIHHGADATAVLAFLRDYVFAADQERETALKTVSRELARARLDMGIMSDAVRSVRDRLDDDDADRVRRQRELDDALARLGENLEAQDITLGELRRGQALARRWLALLTLFLLAVAVVLAAVVWYEVALFARALFDAAGPTLASWRR